jgi:hypothetical protein
MTTEERNNRVKDHGSCRTKAYTKYPDKLTKALTERDHQYESHTPEASHIESVLFPEYRVSLRVVAKDEKIN